MIPSTETRLASMASAMTGAVLPALGKAHPFATEQAQLVAGHLAVLKAQEPYADEFERLDYNRLRVFAVELLAASSGGPRTDQASAALRDLLAGPVPYTITEIRAAHDKMSAAIGGLIAQVGIDGTEESLRASDEVGLRHERENALRYRAYFAAMGYEDGTVPMPDLPTLMADFRDALASVGPAVTSLPFDDGASK
jgi:hypothetical protein